MTFKKAPCGKSTKKNARPIPVETIGRGLRIKLFFQASFAVLAISLTVKADAPQQAAIRRHVEILASPEYGGRSGEVAAKSRTYIIDAFQKLKLEPLFDGSWYQDIPGAEAGTVMGRNVGAKIIGNDPKLKDEWVILAAHFDHVGIRNGVLYPGADDNASAVAMMLEIARCLAESPEKPRRSVMLIGFDLEERGLVGSRYFAEHSPVPLDRVVLFITADMIGRALGGVCKPHVFVMGTEHYPPSLTWVNQAATGEPLEIGILGADLLLIDRSDYGPFRAKRIPFLFFSTGENPCYHKPTDIAATLDYPKAEAISRVMYKVVRTAIDAPARPIWTSPAQVDIAEARTLRDVYRILLKNRAELQIGRTPVYLMESSFKLLDDVIARGQMTASERASLIRVARIVLASVF